MNFKSLVKSAFSDRIGAVLYVLLVCLLLLKVLWGYWDRDLTYGDTSSYFQDAVRWHLKHQVNIVWSPLYTAYFGSWLGVSENAIAATFLHRIGLILISTGLIAWLGFITLPRIFALTLVAWWVVLPIHYDTLYEVHLFGALPIFLMAIICMLVNDRWRMPLLLCTALVSTFLIRNEYILAVGVFSAMALFNLFRKNGSIDQPVRGLLLRFGAVLVAAGLFVVSFYSISYVKGTEISAWSAPKHTVNMCQVYAFGYKQRHSDWSGSPWTDCSTLMQSTFNLSQPTLREMISANPGAVAEHFIWNLSLTRAGMEVLLFNATSAKDNPDYIPVFVVPVIPSLLLGLSLLIVASGFIGLIRKVDSHYSDAYRKLIQMSPLLLATVVMVLAIIVTQRPRPSYLFGFAVLYIWVVLIMFTALTARFIKHSEKWAIIFIALLIVFLPTYRSLPLPSKSGVLGNIYEVLRPQASRLCKDPGLLGASDYLKEINLYLCSPFEFGGRQGVKNIIAIGTFPERALSGPMNFVDELNNSGVKNLIIDPYLIPKYRGLKSCLELRDVLLSRGWEQLAYSSLENGSCIAAYVR